MTVDMTQSIKLPVIARFTFFIIALLLLPAGVHLDQVYGWQDKDGEATKQKEDEEYYELLRLFVDTLDQIDRNYVDNVSRRDLMEAAIEGMLKKLDPYSNYIPPSRLDQFKSGVENQFGGIGIRVTTENGKLEVITPLPNTPAYRAGLKPGDIITTIEGQATEGLEIADAVKLLKGKVGDPVKIVVLTPSTEESREVSVNRALVQVESTLGYKRNTDNDAWDYFVDSDSKIGYVQVTSFGRNTAAELKDVMKKLKKDDFKGLILDLRFNPGGLLTAAIEMCDLFISEGRIVSTEGRNIPKRVWDAKKAGTYDGFPMVVLVNRFSASASEILSACLQDHDRAIIVGERSFGKGSVQNIIELEGGQSALKITTAGYFRPSGKNIDKRTAEEGEEWGVSPNEGFAVQMNDELMATFRRYRRDLDILLNGADPIPDFLNQYAEFKDPQLEKAVETIKQELSKEK